MVGWAWRYSLWLALLVPVHLAGHFPLFLFTILFPLCFLVFLSSSTAGSSMSRSETAWQQACEHTWHRKTLQIRWHVCVLMHTVCTRARVVHAVRPCLLASMRARASEHARGEFCPSAHESLSRHDPVQEDYGTQQQNVAFGGMQRVPLSPAAAVHTCSAAPTAAPHPCRVAMHG